MLIHFSFEGRLGIICGQGSGTVGTQVFWTEILHSALTVSCDSCMAEVKVLQFLFCFVFPNASVAGELSTFQQAFLK